VKETLFGWLRRHDAGNSETPNPQPVQTRSISNADLTEGDIPGEDANWDEWSGIPSFAASFNGYQYWGSFEKCFQVGDLIRTRDLRDLTLTELRTALFCLYRSIDGCDKPNHLARAQLTIAQIRDRVRRRMID
jgi:hypothetical protein